MATFRDFEQGRWEDAGVCTAYADRLGDLVVQAVEPLLDAVGVHSASQVLDVATGDGLVAGAAAKRGAADVVGLDFSAMQLRRAREAHPGVRFEQGDAEALPFDDARFDVVVCNFGVPHFGDPDAFVRDSRRVLRPGGRLGYTVWATPEHTKAYGAILGAVTEHGTFEVGLPPGPNMFFHADAQAALASLTDAGFEDLSVTTVPQVWVLDSAGGAMEAIESGTARTSALLAAQTPAALIRIRSAVADAMETYRVGPSTIEVPMPAVLVRGTAPHRH